MSRSLTPFQAIVLGLVVLTGAALVVAVVFVVGSRRWLGDDAFHVRVGFPQVQGVEKGTRVRIQGIEAGEVVALEPPTSAGGQVMLRLRLKNQFRTLVRKNATVRIDSVGMIGGKVLEIDPGSNEFDPVEDNDILQPRESAQLADLLNDGKLAKGLNAAVELMEKSKETVESSQEVVKKSVETLDEIKTGVSELRRVVAAAKKVPYLGGLIEDPQGLLDRPGWSCNVKRFREEELFQPGRAALTSQGESELDGLHKWLDGLKHNQSEVVVVSYADPAAEPAHADKLTAEQSKAVVEYLKDNLKAHRLWGPIWTRKVIPLGMGVKLAPAPAGSKSLRHARTEILVFVKQ